MPLAPLDTIAKFVVGANDWVTLNGQTRVSLEVLSRSAELAINQMLGGRLGIKNRVDDFTPNRYNEAGYLIPELQVSRIIKNIRLRYAPLHMEGLAVFTGEDFSTELHIDQDFVVPDVVGGVSLSGSLYRKAGWSDNVRVLYQGGYDIGRTTEQWVLIETAFLLILRDGYVKLRKNQTLGGQTVGGELRSEDIGKYSYELGTSGGASRSGSGGQPSIPAEAVNMLSSLMLPRQWVG